MQEEMALDILIALSMIYSIYMLVTSHNNTVLGLTLLAICIGCFYIGRKTC